MLSWLRIQDLVILKHRLWVKLSEIPECMLKKLNWDLVMYLKRSVFIFSKLYCILFLKISDLVSLTYPYEWLEYDMYVVVYVCIYNKL